MINKILVYGTLRPGHGAYHTFGLRETTRDLGEVRIPGSMYHLGGFPGVRLDGEETGIVCNVLEISDLQAAPDVLERLDAYEGYREDNPHNSLYLRKVVDVPGRGAAYIYEINRDVEAYARIESGDWNDCA